MSPAKAPSVEDTVCKLIDTTTCIGCKACEVACMEWNDLPFGETVFGNTYQTMPETRWNYWNLILFNEHEREDGSLMWLMRKNQCMHCAEPGLPGGMPCRRRHRPIHQRHRRFSAGQVHRLRLLHHRLPVQYSEIQYRNKTRVQMHAVH